MTDPGLPPKPRTLNLLDTLVKEEEARDKERRSPKVVIPTEGSGFSSPEYFDTDKQQILSREASASSYKEFKMKETDTPKSDPKSGFKGKKISKRLSPYAEKAGDMKQKQRPFSADYHQNQRNKSNSNNMRNGRPLTSKGPRDRRSSSPKHERSRSPRSSSSDSYSSDDEFVRGRRQQRAGRSDREKRADHDDFFDSDNGSADGDNRDRRRADSPKYRSSSSASTDSYSSSEDENKPSTSKEMNGHSSKSKESRDSKVMDVAKDGRQKTRTDSESSDYNRMVVVDDYSSSFSSSDDEIKQVETKPEPKKVRTLKPKTTAKSKSLLSRKKRPNYKICEITPDQYLEGKLQQKYVELEELMACNFVDQRSQVTRHHLYQMELLRDQYRGASHGLPASTLIIPRSLPEEMRNKKMSGQHQRPMSGKRVKKEKRKLEDDQASYDNAYGTIRSVMAAEHARNTNKIRTDVTAERPSSGKRSMKKKKPIEAKLKAKHSESEEDVSEKPSISSKGSQRSTNPDSLHSTPRTGPAIDHHIKYTENKKLKKWLKEKDKIYRQNLREDKKKKREEREKVISEANKKIERRIESQKAMKKWMKEKNKELYQKHKEDKQREEEQNKHVKKDIILPGDAMRIRPQSAPVTRKTDNETKQTQDGTPHPPQTKFIYKRPVAGKIKLRMEVRGKSPVAEKSESETKDTEKESEKERAKQMRMSYDEWVRKKNVDYAQKKKEAEERKAMAKSDPELDRIVPDIAKKRIEEKLNMRKKINTGIKQFDDKANKSFGGASFDEESPETDRPKNPYKLEGDRTVKRPSTAPAGRPKVPHPKKSATSPRKAVIPKRVDKVMSNNDQSNPFQLPFPPEKGCPEYVAARQRKIFADQITERLDEIEQRALLNAELISAGVADVEGDAKIEVDTLNLTPSKEKGESENDNKHANITELMYSPKKREESSDSSEEESKQETEKDTELENAPKVTVDINTSEVNNTVDNKDDENENKSDFNSKHVGENTTDTATDASGVTKSIYKTFDNLNELSGDNSDSKEDKNATDDLNLDIEHLKERVAALKMNTVLEPQISLADFEKNNENNEDINNDETTSEAKFNEQNKGQIDPNIIGILKESKRGDTVPTPEKSDEPLICVHIPDNEGQDLPSPQEDGLSQSRKRVSFNEQTEVFQSFDSSTETITPDHQDDFDVDAESLDSQPYYVDDPDWDDTEDKPEVQLATEKVSINIGGFELNPTVISTEFVEQDDNDIVKDGKDKPDNEDDPDNHATFLTEEPNGNASD